MISLRIWWTGRLSGGSGTELSIRTILRAWARGAAETFFQHREACNGDYETTVDTVERYMDMVSEKIGKPGFYKPFSYYGAEDAEEIIIAMGSVNDAAQEVVDYLNGKGRKTGIVIVRLYRPFPQSIFCHHT